MGWRLTEVDFVKIILRKFWTFVFDRFWLGGGGK